MIMDGIRREIEQMKKRKGERTEPWVPQHHRAKEEKNKGQKKTKTF